MMTEKYPHFSVYNELYARYLKRSPIELLRDYAHMQPGDHVLDLCGGNGRASLAAKELGAERVLYIDREKDMISYKMLEDNEIEYLCIDVGQILQYLDRENFNVIICQQAINYWFKYVDVNDIANTLSKNGVFIFNTFNTKPFETPTIKAYEFNNKKYLEVSYYADGVVYHVQTADGLPPHTTQFDWISSEEYHEKLSRRFNVTEHKLGSTSIYVCKVK